MPGMEIEPPTLFHKGHRIAGPSFLSSHGPNQRLNAAARARSKPWIMRNGNLQLTISMIAIFVVAFMSFALAPHRLEATNLPQTAFLQSMIQETNSNHPPIRWTRNITEFPAFMMRWPTEEMLGSLHGVSCDISDFKIPHILDFTHYPRTYNNEVVFESFHGNLSEVWRRSKGDGATTAGDGITATAADDQNPMERIKTVVCSVKDYSYADEFPHQMQHVVPCWSLWQSFPHAEHIFLIDPRKFGVFFMNSHFSKGMARVLEANNVSLVQSWPKVFIKEYKSDPRELLAAYTIREEGYRGVYTDDMEHFRRRALAARGLDQYQEQFCGATTANELEGTPLHAASENNDGEPNGKQFAPPRIAIFNRKSTRRLIGAHNMSDRIREAFRLPYTPPVFFFERIFFKDQMEAFANVDILLTPHGAGLAGIPFMPRCGGVIEILPNLYGRTEFYGTLAAMSGVNHSFIYLGEGPVQDPTLLSPDDKKRARDTPLCAPQQAMITAIRTQIDRWQRCCRFSNAGASGGLG